MQKRCDKARLGRKVSGVGFNAGQTVQHNIVERGLDQEEKRVV